VITIAELNALGPEEFAAQLGPVFEHSPWIAAAAWRDRPFFNRDDIHAAMCAAVERAGEGPLMELIRAHPDLVGRLAQQGQLTAESQNEQSSAGLLALDPETMAAFEARNAAYREAFGFPFIICARLNSPSTILGAFDLRLKNSRPVEIATAWGEIRKIAALRLADLIREDS